MKQDLNGMAFTVHLDIPYNEARERVIAALKKEGFGVLTEIDVKETLKKKLNATFRKYAILGACNPPLAHRALTAEPTIGLLLPCNVIVYEKDEGSVVSLMNPGAMIDMVGNPDLTGVATESEARLRRVAESLEDDL